GGPSNPSKARKAPTVPPIWRPNTTAKLTMLGPGRKVAERVGLVEFLGRHPLALVDHHAARPVQDPAEAEDRDHGECDEQFEQRRRRAHRSIVGHGARLNRGATRGLDGLSELAACYPERAPRTVPMAGLSLSTLCTYIQGAGASRLWR